MPGIKPSWLVAGLLMLHPHSGTSSAIGQEKAPEASAYRQRGPHEPASLTADWADAKRGREVPVKIYFPKSGEGPLPVIVFSHGLGGSRAGYSYLGRHWASYGYVSVHLQHKGSDSEVWQKAQQNDFVATMRAAAQDPANAVNRPQDVTFALDQLEKLRHDHPQLAGRLDLGRIGMAGHSFGAYTTLAVAGQVFIGPRGREMSLGDPRVKAFVAMSPPGPRRKEQLDRMYGGIKIPGLHMTGTRDTSPIGITEVADRRVPYDHIAATDQYLVVFREGDHMVFSGRQPALGDRAKDAHLQDLIRATTTAFWDAYLKGDPKAKAWLAQGGLRDALGAHGVLEKK